MKGTGCAFPCVGLAFIDISRRTIFNLAIVGIVLIVIGCCFMVVMRNVLSNHSINPILVLCGFGTLIVGIGFILGGHDNGYLCRNSTMRITQNDGLNICTAQGFLLFWGKLIACFSWSSLCFQSYLEYYHGRDIRDKNSLILCFLTIVVSVLLLIIAATLKTIGFDGISSSCFIKAPYRLYIFEIPLIISIAFGSICSILVIWKYLTTITKKRVYLTSDGEHTGSEEKLTKSDKLTAIDLTGVCLLLISMAICSGFHFFSLSRTQSMAALWKVNIEAYTNCALKSFNGTTASTDICGTIPHALDFSVSGNDFASIAVLVGTPIIFIIFVSLFLILKWPEEVKFRSDVVAPVTLNDGDDGDDDLDRPKEL